MNLATLTTAGIFTPAALAEALLTEPEEIVSTAGLPRDVLTDPARTASREVQCRLRQMAELINRVEPRMGSPLLAYAWIRSERLPGKGGMTASQMLRAGRAGEALELIDQAIQE